MRLYEAILSDADKEKNKSCNRKEEYSLLFQERKIKEVEMIRISKETPAHHIRSIRVRHIQMGKSLLYHTPTVFSILIRQEQSAFI